MSADLEANVYGAIYESTRVLKVSERCGHVCLEIQDGEASLTPDQAVILAKQLEATAKSAREFI